MVVNRFIVSRGNIPGKSNILDLPEVGFHDDVLNPASPILPDGCHERIQRGQDGGKEGEVPQADEVGDGFPDILEEVEKLGLLWLFLQQLKQNPQVLPADLQLGE